MTTEEIIYRSRMIHMLALLIHEDHQDKDYRVFLEVDKDASKIIEASKSKFLKMLIEAMNKKEGNMKAVKKLTEESPFSVILSDAIECYYPE